MQFNQYRWRPCSYWVGFAGRAGSASRSEMGVGDWVITISISLRPSEGLQADIIVRSTPRIHPPLISCLINGRCSMIHRGMRCCPISPENTRPGSPKINIDARFDEPSHQAQRNLTVLATKPPDHVANISIQIFSSQFNRDRALFRWSLHLVTSPNGSQVVIQRAKANLSEPGEKGDN